MMSQGSKKMKPLFIIGYMGCGKTTFGQALSRATGKDFIDLDDYIESKVGKTIKQIFELSGEEGFRKIEKSALVDVSGKKDVIIACGGGTPCFYDNIDVINGNGVSVWLDASVDVLYRRLTEEKEKRPLIEKLKGEELKEKIRNQLSQRMPFYSRALIKWDGELLENENEIRENIFSFITSYPGLGFAITNPLL